MPARISNDLLWLVSGRGALSGLSATADSSASSSMSTDQTRAVQPWAGDVFGGGIAFSDAGEGTALSDNFSEPSIS